MTSKHTPPKRPWRLELDGSPRVLGADHFYVCSTLFVDDARLIAAAPDLLEALKAVDLARLTDDTKDWQRATDLTDAAIAKAEGR